MLNVVFPEEKTNKRKSPEEDDWLKSSPKKRGKPRIKTGSQKRKQSDSDLPDGCVNAEKKSSGGKAGNGSGKSLDVKWVKKSVERDDYKFKDAYTLSDELKKVEEEKQAGSEAKKTKAGMQKGRARDVTSTSKKSREPRKKQNVETKLGNKKVSKDVKQSKPGPKKVKEKKHSQPTPNQKKNNEPAVDKQSSYREEPSTTSPELRPLQDHEGDNDKNSKNQKKTNKKRKHADNVHRSGKRSKSSKKPSTVVPAVHYKTPASPEEKALKLAVVAEVKKVLKKKKLSKEVFKFICKHCAGNIFTRLAENSRISKPKKLVRSRKEKIKALIDTECMRVVRNKHKAKS